MIKESTTIWRPRAVSRQRIEERRRLARAASFAVQPLDLPGLAALIRTPRAAVEVVRVEPAPQAMDEPVVPVALRGEAGAEAVLVVPLALARGIVDLALARPAGGPGGLSSGEEGVLLYALDRAGGDWIAAGGPRYRLKGVLADAEQAADYLGEAVWWQVAARFAAGSLEAPLWLWSVAPGAGATPARLPARLGAKGLPVSWRVEVGDAVIPARELADLAPGDVVELDGLCHPQAAVGRSVVSLRSGLSVHFARWLDRRRLELVSTGERRSRMDDRPTGSTEVKATLEDTLDPDAAAMEVRLQVEVGRVAIALEQALSLVAGSVLELDRDVGPGVQVRVGDRLVARGELVACEGRLAVQITEVP